MDVRFINPFIASTKAVFKTMVATDIDIGKPFVIPASEEQSTDVSAVIGLSGGVVGCVVLSLPMSTACNLASKFAGVPITREHPDFSDALGELANMIAGQAKARLADFKISISLPSVIVGEQHVVSQSRQKPRLGLPCQCDLGPFRVEIAMVVEKKSAQPQVPAVAGCAGA